MPRSLLEATHGARPRTGRHGSQASQFAARNERGGHHLVVARATSRGAGRRTGAARAANPPRKIARSWTHRVPFPAPRHPPTPSTHPTSFSAGARAPRAAARCFRPHAHPGALALRRALFDPRSLPLRSPRRSARHAGGARQRRYVDAVCRTKAGPTHERGVRLLSADAHGEPARVRGTGAPRRMRLT